MLTEQKVDGITGGYIAYSSKDKVPDSVKYKIESSMDEHKNNFPEHMVKIIHHKPGDFGVSDPLNLMGTFGWKCSTCSLPVMKY